MIIPRADDFDLEDKLLRKTSGDNPVPEYTVTTWAKAWKEFQKTYLLEMTDLEKKEYEAKLVRAGFSKENVGNTVVYTKPAPRVGKAESRAE